MQFLGCIRITKVARWLTKPFRFYLFGKAGPGAWVAVRVLRFLFSQFSSIRKNLGVLTQFLAVFLIMAARVPAQLVADNDEIPIKCVVFADNTMFRTFFKAIGINQYAQNMGAICAH